MIFKNKNIDQIILQLSLLIVKIEGLEKKVISLEEGMETQLTATNKIIDILKGK